MTETKKRSGSCLCGAVRITAPNAKHRVGACHCSMCRTWGGGPLLAVDCGTDVEIEGEDHITVFDSSEWAERWFCSTCGTHLFYRLKQSGQFIASAGFFSDQTGFTFDHQVFVDERPDYYEFANQTHEMTGAEVFAKWGGG
jgi:hypothetical protein